MDQNYSTPLEANGSDDMPYNYYQPKGLYGFIKQLEFNVTSPQEYYEDAYAGNTAEVFAFSISIMNQMTQLPFWIMEKELLP